MLLSSPQFIAVCVTRRGGIFRRNRVRGKGTRLLWKPPSLAFSKTSATAPPLEIGMVVGYFLEIAQSWLSG